MNTLGQYEAPLSTATERRANEAAPSSTTAVSGYVNIPAVPTSSRRFGALPTLQTRVPATEGGQSPISSMESTRRQPFNETRESSLVMSTSYKTDESMQKYLRELMSEMGIDAESGLVSTVMPAPHPDSFADPEEVDDSPLSDPALVAAGLFRRRHLGLLISVVCASLLSSSLKRGVLPLMRSELQMAPYQADAAEILVMLPWSSMFFIGFVSDCFSMFGTHRKSYVVAGWVLVVVALFILAIVTYAHAAAASNGVGHSAAFVNGAVFLLGIACFGGISTVVMAEVYFVAMSKRERLPERGEVVGMMLLVQFLFETVGQTLTNYVVFQITGLGVQPLFSLRQITLFLSLVALLPLVATIFLFQEDTELMRTGSIRETEVERKMGVVEKLKDHVKIVWSTLQRESTWSVVRFLVLFVFFFEFLLRYPHLVLDEVCGVNVLTVSTGKIIADLLTFGAVMVWRMFLLNTNWKKLAILTFVGAMWLPQMLYFQFVLFNVSRDMGLYMFATSTKAFVRGIIVALQVAMAVEIAPRGAEGVITGAIVSIGAVVRLVATTISNAVSYAFDTQSIVAGGLNVQMSLTEEIQVQRDPTSIVLPKALEHQVLLALLVCYSVKLLAVGGVGFLPNQKQHLQWLHRFGKPNPRHAVWTVAILVVSLLVAATFNVLVVTPRTSCLKAFGGKGCTTETG